MNHDPNELVVISDVEKQTAPIEPVSNAPQVGGSEDQPIIPTIEDLNAKSAVFNDPPNLGVDADAPYGRNKDGSPAKKRGRKTLTGGDLFERLDSVTPSTQSQAHRLPSGSKPVIVTDYRPVANLATGLWIGIPQIFFGEDWKPENEGQEKVIAEAFHSYFRAKGIAEMSPEIGLYLALGSYTIVRINKPTVKSRLESGVAWLKSRFKR